MPTATTWMNTGSDTSELNDKRPKFSTPLLTEDGLFQIWLLNTERRDHGQVGYLESDA